MLLIEAIRILSIDFTPVFLPLVDEFNGQLATGNPNIPFIPVVNGIVTDNDVFEVLEQHAIAA